MGILMVTGIDGAKRCAEAVRTALGLDVDIAVERKAALEALRRREYLAVVMDGTLAECDPAAAEAIWEHAGLAIPLQINFAVCGAARLEREIRAGLRRRKREQMLSWRAAAEAMETEMKSTVAGLLLTSQLALAGSGVSAAAAEKMRKVSELAGQLQRQLGAWREMRAAA